MSKNEEGGSGAEHRLFHAIVLMGSSIALGCGGEVTGVAGDPDEADAAGARGEGSTGSGSGGRGEGSTLSGAGGRAAAGGSTGIGGSFEPPPPPPPQAGGAPSAGAGGSSPALPPPPCPPAQWRCNQESVRCDYSIRGYDFPTDCSCEPSRPLSAEECGPGRVLVCNLAATGPDGTRLDEGIPFGCACMDASLSCDAACQDLDGAPRYERSCAGEGETDGIVQYLCGCAVIVLR